MAEHNEVGKWGEQLVIDKLITEGFTIMEHNWKLNHLEVDIIASRGEEIIFVEVKTRRNASENPLEAMTPKKISNLCKAAETYIRMNRVPLNPRFDVAAIVGGQHDYALEYIPNAFLPPLRCY